MTTFVAAVVLLVLVAVAPTVSNATSSGKNGLPRPFVYLRDIDATIQQDIRYFGAHNFLGRQVRGYRAPECVLTRKTALRLKRVQARIRRDGYKLKVYDCYRPQRAVRDFVRWAARAKDMRRKRQFYATLDKRNLFSAGYISKRSTHPHGNTVDLTIVPLGSSVPKFDKDRPQTPCHWAKARRVPDNSLDYGTGYDCFHARSGRGRAANDEVARNRAYLNGVMSAAGFKNYWREWWHFTLKGAGAGAHDFPITPRRSSARPAVAAKSVPETEVPLPTRGLRKSAN